MLLPLRLSEENIAIYNRIEEETLKELVRNCVHAFIVLGQNGSAIKKADLNRLVFSSNYQNPRTHQAIIQKANKELCKTFGMRLFDLEDKTNPRYFLVNSKTEFSDLFTRTDESCEELAILYFILLDIFASPDERVNEQDFSNSLKPLEISKETLKLHLDSYVKKQYLSLDKRQDARFYSWGPRASAEIDLEEFFSRFLEVMGEESDKNWPDLRKRLDKLKLLS